MAKKGIERVGLFISWSGERSRDLAICLRRWVPQVLEYVDPWVSDTDLRAGDRWAQVIAQKLDHSNFGIICLTPENLESQWMLFEAGALAKSVKSGRVVPLLLDLEYDDLIGPLAQFHASKVNMKGIREIIYSINRSSSLALAENRLEELFVAFWPKLEPCIKNIPSMVEPPTSVKRQHELLIELSNVIKGLELKLQNQASGHYSDSFVPPRDSTIKKLLEERVLELTNTLDKLNELSRLKSDFVSNISHELRTPLAHIIGYVDLLSEEALGPLTDEQKSAIAVLTKSNKRLSSLIDNLLFISFDTA